MATLRLLVALLDCTAEQLATPLLTVETSLLLPGVLQGNRAMPE